MITGKEVVSTNWSLLAVLSSVSISAVGKFILGVGALKAAVGSGDDSLIPELSSFPNGDFDGSCCYYYCGRLVLVFAKLFSCFYVVFGSVADFVVHYHMIQNY